MVRPGKFEGALLYLETVGRRTGKMREVELWFAEEGDRLYFLAHQDSAWWRNVVANPNVRIRIGTQHLRGVGRIVDFLRQRVYEMFQEKYGRAVVDEWYGDPARSRRKAVEVSILN